MAKKGLPVDLLSATDVTTSYGGCDTAGINVLGFDQIRFMFAFVWADSTSLELLLQFSDDEGTTWYDDHRVSSGTATENEITLATSASGNFALAVNVRDVTYMRIRAKQTAGSATGNTLAVSYTAEGVKK